MLKQQKIIHTVVLNLICILGLSLSCHKMIFSGFQQIQTDPGDTRFNNYVLEHEYQWITGNPLNASFWDPPNFYPAKNILAYSDILLGAAPLYWLTRILGFLPDTAFQLWMIEVLAINFFVAYWVFRQLQFSFFPALVVGYLFAFANMRIHKLGHQQLLPQFFTLIAVLAIDKIFIHLPQQQSSELKSQIKLYRRSWILVFASMLVLQLYAGFYLGWFAVFGTFILMITSLFIQETRVSLINLLRKEFYFLILISLISFFILMPMTYHYWIASHEVGWRLFQSVSPMLNRIASWLNMSEKSLVYSFLHRFSAFQRITMQDEQASGLGLVTLIVAIIGFRMRFQTEKKQTSVRLCCWMIGILMLITTYTGRRFFGFEPWQIFYSYFPGAQAIRALSRICLLILIPTLFGIAYFFETLKNQTHKERLIVWGLFALIAVEQINQSWSYNKFEIRKNVDHLASSIPSSCQTFLYTRFDSNEMSWKLQIDAIWAGIIKGLPSINGFSGNSPKNWCFGEVNHQTNAQEVQNCLLSWTQASHISFDPKCWIQGF